MHIIINFAKSNDIANIEIDEAKHCSYYECIFQKKQESKKMVSAHQIQIAFLIMENSDLTEKLKRISMVDESASVQDEFKQNEFGSLRHFSSSLFSLIICNISEEQR